MANDWTIGVEITDIVDVATGDADSNDAMVMIATKTGVWSGTDIVTFATLSFTPVVSGGSFTKTAYVGFGKFVAGTDNGKLYSLYFSAPDVPPVVTLMHTDSGASPITALAHAEAGGEIGFANNNKVYTIPIEGGSVIERMDSESVIESGSKVYDLDYSVKGWVLLVEKADNTAASVIATEDWSSTVTEGFTADFSDSLPRAVNYYEDVADGTWMIGREDGEVKQTTDLDTWRPEATLWVATTNQGHVAHSTDGTNWSVYSGANTSNGTDISFGKDDSGNDLWIVANDSSSEELSLSSDPTQGAGSWTLKDIPGGDYVTECVAYGANGTWLASANGQANATISKVFRSTDGGATWAAITNNTAIGTGHKFLTTDGNGNWLLAQPANEGGGRGMSTDDGLTWTVPTISPYGGTYDIEYANGMWMWVRAGYVFTASDADFQASNWTQNGAFNKLSRGLCHVSGQTWVCGGNEQREVWRTTDNGTTWTQVSSIPWVSSGHLITSMATDGTDIILLAHRPNKIYRSSDMGGTWTEVFDIGVGTRAWDIAYNKVLPFTS